jgi:hypothetical protein
METKTDQTNTVEKDDKDDKDVIARLAGRGEEAIKRLADLPGGQRALEAYNDLKVRVDDLSRRVRGIDALENRVAKLEKEVAALRRAQKPATEKAPTRKA